MFQNSQRLIRMDNTNREQNQPTGDQLLQKSMYGDWNIVNKKITDVSPSFVRTGDTFLSNHGGRFVSICENMAQASAVHDGDHVRAVAGVPNNHPVGTEFLEHTVRGSIS